MAYRKFSLLTVGCIPARYGIHKTLTFHPDRSNILSTISMVIVYNRKIRLCQPEFSPLLDSVYARLLKWNLSYMKSM